MKTNFFHKKLEQCILKKTETATVSKVQFQYNGGLEEKN